MNAEKLNEYKDIKVIEVESYKAHVHIIMNILPKYTMS